MSGFFWLASYPKSGNTWLRLALLCLKEGKPVDFSERQGFAPLAASRRLFDATLGIESSDLSPAEIENLRPRCYETQAEEAAEPLLSKTHDAWSRTGLGEPLFPPAVTLGGLHIVRDPRDVAISFAHHLGITIDAAIDLMANPRGGLAPQGRRLFDQLPQRLGLWSDHVAGWLAAPGAQPSLLIRYEDMHADAPRELARVLEYIRWSATPQALAQAIEHTRFDKLRAAEDKQGFHERPPEAERFFRKGKAGGWRTELTAAQAKRIEETHGTVMRQLGYL